MIRVRFTNGEAELKLLPPTSQGSVQGNHV